MRLGLIKIILFLFSLNLANQKDKEFKGYPLLNNYSLSDFEINVSPQNWSVVQDARGILFFANTVGVIDYDGVSWDVNHIPNNLVRSLSVNESGAIFVGGLSEIGKLIIDSTQSFKYYSFINKIDPEQRNFSSVFQTFQNKNGIYFRSAAYLFRLFNDSLITLKPSIRFSRSFLIDSTIYVGEDGKGLYEVDKNSLKPVQGNEFFAENSAWIFLKMDTEKYFIATLDNRLFVYDGFNIFPFQTQVDHYIKKNRSYYGTRLADGNIALATLQGGITIINKEGQLVKYFNEATGLKDNNVKFIFQDIQENLWLALNNGITKIEYSSPFSVYDERMGLDGIILSTTKFQDNLYAGTTSGIYFLKPINTKDFGFDLNGFQKVGLINSNVWTLLNVNDELLASSNDGIYLINSANRVRKISSSKVYAMYRHDKDADLIITGLNGSVGALYNNGTKWFEYNLYSQVDSRITSIHGSKEGDIWIGTLSAGVFRISKSANILENISNQDKSSIDESFVAKYGTLHGLPSGGINVFRISGRPYFSTLKGIFKFVDRLQRFVPDLTFGTMFADGSRGVFQLIEDEKGNVWIHSNSENFLAEYQKDGSYKIISKPFRRLEKSQVNAIYPDGDVVWFGRTNSEIIKYDTKKKKNFVTDFNALIRRVLINGDSLIYGGAPLPADFEPLSLTYNNRNLRFQYACPFYEGEERMEFQYKLEGFDEDWSESTLDTKKDYTNLSEGNYTFKIRAINVYGDTSRVGQYTFKVLPPYYRTIWAYFTYAVLFVSFGFVIVKWRINKLEKEKQNLEAIVDEKTKEVQEQADKLKELDKIKSRFFTNISHEFRTPLTLIVGPTEQMLKEEKSNTKKKNHSLILRNSEKLLNLINQLLDISKLESGKMQLRAKKINVVHFIREITFMFESLADRKKVKLGFKFEHEELELYCDTDKIEKVIVNLLSNAFKFTEENGEVTVIISKVEESEDFLHGYAKIMVMDTGIGIPAENLKHIFDPFYQADASIKREYEGTGIGLSLVKEFVELHKGNVTVESSEGKGTRFIIKLPLGNAHLSPGEIINEDHPGEYNDDEIGQVYLDADLEDAPSENESPVEFLEENLLKEKDTVLVVDDNKDVRTYIKDHLVKDFKIIEASDGEEGLAKAKEISPDLIVSDVMMPKMDGFEFCENIKTDVNTSHIPMILLTAKVGDENIMQGLETGADDYVTKPFNVDILLIRIKNLIELRKQIQQKYQKQLFLQPNEIKVSSVDETFLKELHELVEENISDPDFNIENMTDKFSMSYMSLFRKIKALTGEPPVKFLRSYRLKKAAQLLKAKSGNITEIAFSTGFNNSAYFTKCFKEQFNRLPSEFVSVET